MQLQRASLGMLALQDGCEDGGRDLVPPPPPPPRPSHPPPHHTHTPKVLLHSAPDPTCRRYSSTSNGYCNDTASFCTWRVAEVVKRVQQSCLNDHINTAVEASNEACFATCGARNITSDCWITCFYEGVLGSEVAKGGALAGMPLAELDAAWLGAFRE
eukprot:COSAG04_NODE_755_length_10558_cov_3.555407_10_plen_157_part_01